MTGPGPEIQSVLAAQERQGLRDVEVYWKRGRSRRVRVGYEGAVAVVNEEEGWALRVGDERGSSLYASTGAPCPDPPRLEPGPGPLRLPGPRSAGDWRAPSDLETSLLGEVEALALLRAVASALDGEHPGSRLLRGQLEDGSSTVELANNRGVAARYRQRLASLRLWAAGGRGSTGQVELYLAAREARSFSPAVVARRLADRLVIAERGTAPPRRDRGEMLLAPAVGCHLLAGLAPLFLGSDGWERFRDLLDRTGRLASRAVTLVDDGRLRGGWLDAPVDGEGVPTREVSLVEEGIFRQPLLPWWEETSPGVRTSGCRRRPGWRSLPRTGISHFYLKPDPAVPVSALLGSLPRGYYLIAPGGPMRVDAPSFRFALPVLGFEVRGGRPVQPVADAVLTGGIGPLLKGVQAVARDLEFLPLDGAVGAPTLLVSGLEIRAGAG